MNFCNSYASLDRVPFLVATLTFGETPHERSLLWFCREKMAGNSKRRFVLGHTAYKIHNVNCKWAARSYSVYLNEGNGFSEAPRRDATPVSSNSTTSGIFFIPEDTCCLAAQKTLQFTNNETVDVLAATCALRSLILMVIGAFGAAGASGR